MVEKSFRKEVFQIALPVALQSLLQSSFSMIDQIMVGQLGEKSIAAVEIAGKPSFIYTVVLGAIAAIAGIMISQYIGKEEEVSEQRNICVNVCITLVVGAVFLVLAVCFAAPFTRMFTEDREVARDGAAYLKIIGAEDYQALRDRIRIPFVVYDGFFKNEGNICNLLLDDRDGGRQVGNYLKQNGHSRVLCLADNRLLPDYDRFQGLCEGLGEEADFWEIPMKKVEREAYYESRFMEFLNYTAIFAVSDYYAADVMFFLLGKEIRIPEQISVIGFDDTALGRIIKPALTTVRQDVACRAERAVAFLLEVKKKKDLSLTQTIPVRLVVRESSQPAVI